MEEDEEFIKKLMLMLGSGKQIKLKSINGQTIKVSLDPKTEMGSGPEWKPVVEPEANLGLNLNNSTEGSISNNELNEIFEDFSALSKLEINHPLDVRALSNDVFDLQILKSQDQLILQEVGDTNEASLFPEQKIITPEKPKKIQLSNKHQKRANQAVINFMECKKDQENSEINDVASLKETSSSPVIARGLAQEEKTVSKSNPIKETLDFLIENHPEDKDKLEIINKRLQQLEQVEKDKLRLDQEISDILSSSITNSLSIKFDSFDVSMLSFDRQSAEDPLCHIFTQYLKRVSVDPKQHQKNLPSFLFMYSQPMIDQKGREIEEQINYFEEEATIQKILKDGKCRIDYIRERATIDKFHYWIKQGIQILHFSGHGVQSKDNYLLFENDTAVSVKLDSTKLTEILNEQKNPLKMVFVASCHSQSTGKIFIEAGATHVVCVRDDYQILDEACQEFVRIFYLACINESINICEAFSFAKKQLDLTGKFSHHQCEKFILLKNHKNHQCSAFKNKSAGMDFQDLTEKPFYVKNLPSRVQNYIPRAKDLHEIIKLIDKKHRFITVVGQSGIGKSTLVRQLVRYVQFRNLFIDGVIYIEIRSCENMLKLFEALDLELFETSQLKLNKSLTENIQKLVKELMHKNVLIVMDNCQNIMASEEKESFKKVIEALMKNCIKVYFVFTHRTSIDKQIDYCSEKMYELNRLSESQSQSLFFQRVPRKISKQELDQFFGIENNLKQISKHSFFQFLNGHPQAICLTASLLAERSLSELYDLLVKPSTSFTNKLDFDLKNKYSGEERGINKVVETAMKISLNVLKNKHKEAAEMIKILSLLPNGLDSEMMAKLFGSGLKWKETAKKLMNHSLVQCIDKIGLKYYVVHPHIIFHIESEISQDEKIKFHEKICEEIIKRLEKIYRNVGTLLQHSQRAQELFLMEEDNFKVIFLREMSFLGEKNYLKEFYYNQFQANLIEDEEENAKKSLQTTDGRPLGLIISTIEAGRNKRKGAINEKLFQPIKKESIDLILVYYLSILFVVRKMKNGIIDKYLNYAFFIALRRNKAIVYANLLRIKACIYFAQNKTSEARKEFQNAWSEYASEGCGLGSASCQAALGYIKFLEEEHAPAKMNLESALKYYDEISHAFGKHYLNRWLCSLKAKMNRTEKELINHKQEAQKLLKEAKSILRSNNINNTSNNKHKLGVFVFRFLFDNISIFLEASFETDLRPKYIPLSQIQIKKIEEKPEKNMILEEIMEETASSKVEYGPYKKAVKKVMK